MENDDRSRAEMADASVDEASLESMDCSDPPQHGGVTVGPPMVSAARAATHPEPSAARRGRALRAAALFAGGIGLLLWGATRRRSTSRARSSRVPAVVQNVVVGLAATQALDWLSIALYEGEDRETRAAEDAARGHHHAYEVATKRMAGALGLTPSDDAVRRWAWGIHKVFGVAGGMGYAALRRRSQKAGAGAGTLFGSAFFVLADEILVPAFGLTPGPRSFPWKTHARGAASHVAYGVAAELAVRAVAGGE